MATGIARHIASNIDTKVSKILACEISGKGSEVIFELAGRRVTFKPDRLEINLSLVIVPGSSLLKTSDLLDVIDDFAWGDYKDYESGDVDIMARVIDDYLGDAFSF